MTTLSNPRKPLGLAISRGLVGRCPNCGQGRLFRGYLKLTPECEACGHKFSRYRADDGPAYFTILLVGHLVVAPLLCFPFVWESNPLLVCALTLPLIALVTLAALPRVKGAFIGVLWSSGATADQ